MSALLASDSESDADDKPNITINKDYANKYDTWRRKELLQKLTDKYGEDAATWLDDGGDASSDEEEEDEDAAQWTEETDKDFLKTLACLKKKDPAIYDNNVRFFKDAEPGSEPRKKEKKKKEEKPLFLRDYKRQLILGKSSDVTDDEDEGGTGGQQRAESPTLVEEEQAIKESLVNTLRDDDDGNGDDEWGSLFRKRDKTQQELDKENEDYLEWLNGQREHIGDKKVESELKPLREYWNDPKLEEGEKFLRDYILNKRFLQGDDKDHIPTYDEIVHDSDEDLSADERTVEQQEAFEHKFNFRFEEPDQEFVKRYPRTVESTLRRKDDRRKLKRAEVRERKEREKRRKLEELKQLKALKRKELEARIQRLKEITGNADLGFKDEDIEGEFDPLEHDRRMKQLFDDEFYAEEQDSQKPVFPDLDAELEIENWDQWDGSARDQDGGEAWDNADLDPEDPNFNMDCDYDPKAQLQRQMVESTRRRKGRKRQSKFAEVLAAKKPLFDPKDKSFEQYVDDYYSLDFEDVIGDLPCRFKYRKVVPNSFGLTVEEILKAEDKELNSWCSLRRAVQYRPENQELYDVKAYQARAKQEHLKRKYLKSLYANAQGDQPKKEARGEESTGHHDGASREETTARANGAAGKVNSGADATEHSGEDEAVHPQPPDGRKKRKKKGKKHKPANGPSAQTENAGSEAPRQGTVDSGISKRSSKNRKRKQNVTNSETGSLPVNGGAAKQSNENRTHFVPRKKFKNEHSSEDVGISDTRLRAYGIRPKKFKGKLKFGSQSRFKKYN
ncbi:protein KRI1 homolog [Bacillus rossius redtenbacheri]|uniref:protein KRI1 homolog n=1 Tax=Bacillus rossius redtenbacheri TaxID=93214 RepID=UPI002FDE6491